MWLTMNKGTVYIVKYVFSKFVIRAVCSDNEQVLEAEDYYNWI